MIDCKLVTDRRTDIIVDSRASFMIEKSSRPGPELDWIHFQVQLIRIVRLNVRIISTEQTQKLRLNVRSGTNVSTLTSKIHSPYFTFQS